MSVVLDCLDICGLRWGIHFSTIGRDVTYATRYP